MRILSPITLLSVAAAMISAACGSTHSDSNSSPNNPFDDLPVVGEYIAVGDDSVAVIQIKGDDTNVIRLTDLAEDVELIKLENSDEALTAGGRIWISDSRIIIHTDGSSDTKQYDRKGNYIGTVGSRGLGPGEYSIAPFDIYVDEKAGRIYLVQLGADNIIVYDMHGKFIEDMPLAMNQERCQINVNTADSIVTITAMHYTKSPETAIVWTQDFKGNIISKVETPWANMVPDGSNWMYSSIAKDPNNFETSLYSTSSFEDSLYSYRNGTIAPVMTAKFADGKRIHQYVPTPGFFYIDVFDDPFQVSDYNYLVPAKTPFVVDRKTLRGSYAKLMLDNIGPLVINGPWAWCVTPEYFGKCFDPGSLADWIDDTTNDDGLVSEEKMEEMMTFRETINPDDNCYVLIGRWRQR